MTASLRRVEPRDIPAICDLLHTHMNPDFPVARWQRMFAPDWCANAPDLGIVAVDNDRIVGFHGHICSHRVIDFRRERFVNFSSWYILKEYRKHGLGSAMLEMATSDPDVTYTVFSLSPKRIEFFKTLGLSVLEQERLIWRATGTAYDNLELITDPQVIRQRATPLELTVLDHHLDLPVMPVLIATRCALCLLLLSVAKKKDGVTYYDVLYRSNPTLFTERAPHIAEALLPDNGCVLAADKRFVEDGGLGAEIEIIKSPRFYKSSRVKPRDIDLAYSELALLDLKLD